MSEVATDIGKNKCEICGLQATAGILDTNDRIRFTCQDHNMKLYEKIASEGKKT